MDNAKLLEAVRMLQDATKLLDAILVEQIGGCTVVTHESELPEHWYVKNFDKATEWAKSVFTGVELSAEVWAAYTFIQNGENYVSDASYQKLLNKTEITQDQFTRLVYNPWKASLNQPDYDVSNVAPKFEIGDKVDVNDTGLHGTITGLYGTDKYFVKMGHDTLICSGRVLVKVA
jgi:hypothetical protein